MKEIKSFNLIEFLFLKPLRRFRARSSQSSDSSPYTKTRTASGNNEVPLLSSSGKNPYDFESEEDNEIRESTNEVI